MKKLITLGLSVGALLLLATPALARDPKPPEVINDACKLQTTYTNYWLGDHAKDARLTIEFGKKGDTATITAGEHYKLVSIRYDLLDLKENNWVTWEIKGNPEVVDPDGKLPIWQVEVVVEKVCVGVCNDPTASNFHELEEGVTQADASLCVYPVATPSATPVTVLPNTGASDWAYWSGYVLIFGLGWLIGWGLNKKK